MSDYQVQVVYKDAEGWERCRRLKEQPTEQVAFEYAEAALRANGIVDAEIMVLKKDSAFWRVKDRQGRITQRPTTEAGKGRERTCIEQIDALRADIDRKVAEVKSYAATLARAEEKYKRIADVWEQTIKDLKEEVHLLAHYKEEVDKSTECLARKDALIAALDETLSKIVLNARIQPDADMNGVTDCYAVPLDDIAEVRARLAEVRGEPCPK